MEMKGHHTAFHRFRHSLRLCALLPALIGAAAASASTGLVSGERLAMGGDGRGPVSAGLSTFPLGMAQLREGGPPVIFIVAGRFSREPGLFAHEWLGSPGAPILGSRRLVRYPANPTGPQAPPPGTIFQTRDGTVYGFWILDGALVRTRYDADRNEFLPLPLSPLPLRGLPGTAPTPRTNADGRAVERIGVQERADGSLEILLSVPNPERYFQEGALFGVANVRRHPDFDPFDGRGIWRGGLPGVFLYAGTLPGPEAEVEAITDLRQVSPTQREALFSHGSIAPVELGDTAGSEWITGSYLGNFYFYRAPSDGGKWPEAQLVRGTDGRAVRSDYVWTSPISVPGESGRVTDLVVGGEGALNYFRFLHLADDGAPVYAGPFPLLQESALLYTGSLPVLNSVDWDDDGATDLIVGNSEGRILFFRNHGTNAAPDFRLGIPLKAGGEPVHIQPGYTALQGPDEARWGYVSPVVVDWNGNGLPDILSSDARAVHYLFKNVGTRSAPRLAAAAPLYADGLDLHGTWRVRPGAARWGERMAYVKLDADDEFRIYWRIDDVNLRDGGKLRMEDGSSIRANFLPAGATGRSKFTLSDWDGDGVMDILVGTPRHGSVPNPQTGLPQALGLPGATILWLRNTGTNAAPKFAWPRVLHFRGEPKFFGQHEISLALTDLDGPGGPHLLVGDEEGRVHFFAREDIFFQ
jgi:hypothetical protein